MQSPACCFRPIGMPHGWSKCCFHLNSIVLSLCELGCITTTLCYGISFGTSLVYTMYELSSFFAILVHIRCQISVYDTEILCLFAIFLPVHAKQSLDARCALDWVLTCSVTCSWALQSSGECVCHFEFTRYAPSPICSVYFGHRFAFFRRATLHFGLSCMPQFH